MTKLEDLTVDPYFDVWIIRPPFKDPKTQSPKKKNKTKFLKWKPKSTLTYLNEVKLLNASGMRYPLKIL